MQVIEDPRAIIIELSLTTLNVNNVKQFKADIEPYLDKGRHIVLDLSSLTFIDSSGLGAFLFCIKRLQKNGGDLKLCGINKPVRILFEMVRLHQILDIYGTRDEALDSLD